MSQNSLINEYNKLYELSKNTPVNSFYPSECFNSLKNELSTDSTFLYDKSTSSHGPAILQTTQFYNDRMVQLFDQLKETFTNKESFDTISSYMNSVVKLNDAESMYNFINNENNTSSINLQNSNIIFMKWIFILLFILTMIFQLFENSFLRSLSIITFIAAIVVLINIFKIINEFIFSILLLSLFSVIVLFLFFKKMYIPSIVFLIFGAIGCNFYMNYRL